MPHLRSQNAQYERADRWLSRVQERIFFTLAFHDEDVGETVVTAEHSGIAWRILTQTFGLVSETLEEKELGEVLSQGLKQ